MSASHPTAPVGALLAIGLVAGTLDISDNLIFNAFRGITPAMVFRYIASGLIGPRLVHPGAAAVALGVGLHYLIALIWTVVFFLLSRRLGVLAQYPVASGLLYGAAVYLVMNWVVVPLSRVPRAPSAMALASRINGVLALLFCIGLTISLLTRRLLPRG